MLIILIILIKGERYVTASAISPVLRLLEHDILKEKEEDTLFAPLF